LELFYRQSGETGEPLIILHGLYGSGDNWMSIARPLSENFRVYLVDQRNHGRSPHSEDMDYDLMAGDLLEFFNKHQIEKANIIGHSMGGKTAMWFASKHPMKVNKLVVADIAPKSYEMTDSNAGVHKMIISALKTVTPETAASRKEIESRLSDLLPNPQLVMFLLKNIERKNDGSYRWRINIKSIEKDLEKIMNGFSGLSTPVNVPALFLKGEESNYIKAKDLPRIKELFPDSQVITIPKAGHWLHAQQPELFTSKVLEFLKS